MALGEKKIRNVAYVRKFSFQIPLFLLSSSHETACCLCAAGLLLFRFLQDGLVKSTSSYKLFYLRGLKDDLEYNLFY